MRGTKTQRRPLQAGIPIAILLLSVAASLDAGVIDRALVSSMEYPALAGEISSTGSLFGRPSLEVARAVAADSRFAVHQKDALYLLLLRSADLDSPEREALATFVLERHDQIGDGTLLELSLESALASVSPRLLLSLLSDLNARYLELPGSDRLLERIAGVTVTLTDAGGAGNWSWQTVVFSLLVELGRGARTPEAARAADRAASAIAGLIRSEN
jgi:hypothetical protein